MMYLHLLLFKIKLTFVFMFSDICKFLSGDKLGKLSYKDQRLAESLITRSKKQLQDIAKIQPTLQCNEDYVIMNSQGTKTDIYLH